MSGQSRECSRTSASRRNKRLAKLAGNSIPTMYAIPDGSMCGQKYYGYQPYTRDVFGRIIPSDTLYSAATGWPKGYEPRYMDVDED